MSGILFFIGFSSYVGTQFQFIAMSDTLFNTINPFDLWFLEKIHVDGANSFFDLFFPFITDLNKNKYFMLSVVIVLGTILWKKFRKKGLSILLLLILCLGSVDFLSNQMTKKQFVRARPFASTDVPFHVTQKSPAAGNSFASNHAANMFAFATFISFFLGYRLLFFTIAFLIAYSRVYNGVHFPSDVIVGAIIGMILASVWIHITQLVLARFFQTQLQKDNL